MLDIEKYFKLALDKGASDLHLVSNNVPTLRIDGALVIIEQTLIDASQLFEAMMQVLTADQKESYQKTKELDISHDIAGGHFRLNFHQQEGVLGVSARVIPQNVPTPKDIDLDETLYNLSHLQNGLVLVTGPSGSGKSTTLAALINLINKERRSHVITIEDPIEFLFKEEQSIIEQRELGRDTHSFAEAIRRALRQDPNVIMVGEMRDPDTTAATLTAAETGHLVFSTLHTSTAAETISRIVDMFPAHQQRQILTQLSSVLRAVICQQLLPKAGGGLVVAREVLVNTPAIATVIREGKLAQIPMVMETGRNVGMITMQSALKRLLEQGKISEQVYQNRMSDGETLSTYY
jgi:twitching motility protein PilT